MFEKVKRVFLHILPHLWLSDCSINSTWNLSMETIYKFNHQLMCPVCQQYARTTAVGRHSMEWYGISTNNLSACNLRTSPIIKTNVAWPIWQQIHVHHSKSIKYHTVKPKMNQWMQTKQILNSFVELDSQNPHNIFFGAYLRFL